MKNKIIEAIIEIIEAGFEIFKADGKNISKNKAGEYVVQQSYKSCDSYDNAKHAAEDFYKEY